MSRYEEAKKIYATFGVDTDAAIARLKEIPVSLHCWQGDDVTGFDHDGPLTGGIQTTGNYPGKAGTPEELMADMEKAMSLMPGKKKINVHACYAIFEDGEYADRDRLEPKHFRRWAELAKKYHTGLDFNPTFFSHPRVKDGLTLSSPDEETRKFWIAHGKACIRISQYFAEETGYPCVMNIWTGDGYKDIPADRMGPRMRYKESIEEILSEPYDRDKVKPCCESKVFGIGIVPWMVPGGREIAVATSELMKQYDVAVWAHHGMFAAGEDFDLTFGLMHTVEKSAEILVKVLSMTNQKRQTITPDQFRHLAKDFGVSLPEKFLYEK